MGKILSIIFIIFILFIGAWFWYESSQPSVELPLYAPEQSSKALEVYETDNSKGRSDATVTIVLACSFISPECRETATMMSQLLKRYPKDIKIIWKDIPGEEKEAYDAAVAARCAGEQQRFWQYHDRLFIKQAVLDRTELFSQWAEDLGLEVSSFADCMSTRSTKFIVDQSISDGLALGIQTVPYIQINNEHIFIGLQEIETLQETIDTLLAQP